MDQGYLNVPPPATPSLKELLLERISRLGPLPFPEFMAEALYHPELGYYACEPRQVGRGGDFYTSVSVGPLFGELLARRFLKEWENLGRPERWRVIECGAHDGTLAADILSTIERLGPKAYAGLEYVIPEPLPRLRVAQEMSLAIFGENVRITADLDEIVGNPLPGIVFGNELLDALPFHVVEWNGRHWQERRVAPRDDGFAWENCEISVPGLREALDLIGNDFTVGYRTELRTNFREFLEPLTRCLTRGLFIWPDYGFARPEYYHPARNEGTLRTFSKHRAADNPLVSVGEIDITAHVDFTAVAEAAISLGVVPTAFRNQETWLTEVGREWLLSLEGNSDLEKLRQFQTLTHPAHLGGCFHILELTWNQTNMPSNADFYRLGLA